MTEPPPLDPRALQACLAPLGQARTLPAVAYLSEAVLAWERERFFDASWACVGRGSDLPGPGDRVAIRSGGDAVLLVRGQDDRIRGFSSTCRHRGHELLPTGEAAQGRTIRCPYHGWTYGLEGELRAAPGFEDRPGWRVDDPDHALAPVRVEEWRGWLFLNASGDAPPFADQVGNLDQAIAPYEPERLVGAARIDYVVDANWKLIHENYHECYHCWNIHPELCRVTPPDSGIQFEATGLVVGGSMDLVEEAETMSLDGQASAPPLRGIDDHHRRIVNYWGLFPNLLLSTHPDYVLTHRLEPVAPGRTRVACEWLFDPEVAAREEFDPAYAVDFWDVTNRQDWHAVESVQRGAAGRGYRQGPLSDAEIGVHEFVSTVARGYLEGRAPLPLPARATSGS